MSPEADPALPVFDTLCALEQRLHRPEVRSDPGTMAALLHPAFREFGRSGVAHTRDEILAEFTGSPPDSSIWAQDFALEELGGGLALLTYRSAHIGPSGGLERHALRASLWQWTADGWRLRFHQGTPAGAFEKTGP